MSAGKTKVVMWGALKFVCVVAIMLWMIVCKTPVLAQGSITTDQGPLILYVQTGCTHCAKVEAFIEENGIGGNIPIRDVSVDEGASEEFTALLDSQNVPLDSRGVPLLVHDGTEIISGDVPIIEYLRQTFDIPEESLSFSTTDFVMLGAGGVVALGVVAYGVYNGVYGNKKR